MSSKFSRWLRSRTGMQTLIGLAAVLVVVIIVGAVLGWWADLIDLLSGTVAPPPPSYPPPMNGYTCLPTCFDGITDYDGDGTPEPQDGKFLSLPGEDMWSFGGESINVWIGVPGDYVSFELGIFDGDSGKDASGSTREYWNGNWDDTQTETTYTLYADPLKDGHGTTVVGVWHGNQDPMPNNDWFNITLENTAEARGPSGHYFYRLEATRPVEGTGINAFKLRSNGYLSTGQADLVDAQFAIVGMAATMNDVAIIYPQFTGDWNSLGESTYDGTWDFYFYVPPAEWPTRTVTIEIWDGDFDRGTSSRIAQDTDDLNTDGKPDWTTNPYVRPERAGGRGIPADDHSARIYRRTPPVRYTITDPAGTPIYTNEEPSGTEEWERFVITTDPALMDPNLPPNEQADKLTDELQPGWYGWRIEGLDIHNTVWIRFNYDMVTQPPPPPCDASCPRTIGYWKNNVKKVLIDGKTNGVQETPESLKTALYLVAQYSPLYRHGIDVQNPRPIDTVEPLTPEEAHMILQRDQKTYPGGKDQANSMLARALQQNLAAWLNWGSGKICNDTYITLDAYGGYFEGTVWQALQEAQTIILNASGPDDPNLERAKDIGDLINNGLLGEEAEVSVCEDYTSVMPPDKQPPDPHDLPKTPKKPEPPKPVPQPITCDAPRVNTYGVENPTESPFYGIKFEYQSGTEVRDSNLDEFRFVVPADVAANMASVQVEAKAGQDQAVASVTLEGCAFNSPVPCGEPIVDDNDFFAFYFMGAEDNGDGTLTLVFQVQNFTGHALSHVTIGLPGGVVPPSPTGSYQSEVCP
jgi:hypothetical protein